MTLSSQAIVKNIDEHRDAAKWLVTTLDELVERTAGCDPETEQGRLDSVVTRYKSLMPVIEITTSKSSLILRCIDYKDNVQEKTAWLAEAQDSVQLDIPLDSLDTVRLHLQQQEVSCVWSARLNKLPPGELLQTEGFRLLKVIPFYLFVFCPFEICIDFILTFIQFNSL